MNTTFPRGRIARCAGQVYPLPNHPWILHLLSPSSELEDAGPQLVHSADSKECFRDSLHRYSQSVFCGQALQEKKIEPKLIRIGASFSLPGFIAVSEPTGQKIARNPKNLRCLPGFAVRPCPPSSRMHMPGTHACRLGARWREEGRRVSHGTACTCCCHRLIDRQPEVIALLTDVSHTVAVGRRLSVWIRQRGAHPEQWPSRGGSRYLLVLSSSSSLS
jgi:hypothetical protein